MAQAQVTDDIIGNILFSKFLLIYKLTSIFKLFSYFLTIISVLELHKNGSFSLKISSINVTKSAGNCVFSTFTEQILYGKLHLLCSMDTWDSKAYLGP